MKTFIFLLMAFSSLYANADAHSNLVDYYTKGAPLEAPKDRPLEVVKYKGYRIAAFTGDERKQYGKSSYALAEGRANLVCRNLGYSNAEEYALEYRDYSGPAVMVAASGFSPNFKMESGTAAENAAKKLLYFTGAVFTIRGGEIFKYIICNP